nr:histone-lysine N-methyltransferase 2C-like isoform X6 [Cherax quadricarinatus]
MERPHGGSFKDGSSDKSDKGTTSRSGLSSCGSSSGSTSTVSSNIGGEVEEKMDVDKPLLVTPLATLPSSSSITISKATAAQQRASHTPSLLSSSSSVSTHTTIAFSTASRTTLSSSSTPSSDAGSSISRGILGPDMMPTIPLVPVQVPCSRSGVVTIPKIRGRSKGMPLSPTRSGSFQVRKGMKLKRLGGSFRGRAGRRLTQSMSLEERGGLGGDDSPLPLDDEAYAQDDMFIAPTYQDKWPGRVCALCCLGEQSQLGQGELIRHDPTPGYTLPEKITSPSDSNAQESLLSKKLKSSQSSFKEKGKSPRKQVGEALPEPVDEISLVGHSEQPSITILFEPTGHCFVHYMCALWSSTVELINDDTVTLVDQAVVDGASQRCVSCKKFGATLPCKVSGCQRFYHFPCAMSAGASMDLKTVGMVCPSHADKSKDLLVDLACMVCEHSSPESSLLFCSSCGNHYHGLCLKPPVTAISVLRAGWQCPDCKMCQMCRQPSDEIVCGVCDKAYHMACARPFGLSLHKTGWKCKTCRACGDCGSRTPGNGLSSRWHSNFTVCDSCYQLRNKGLACPICQKAYRAIAQKNMAQCTKCKRHVHSMCDIDADLSVIQTKWNADHSYEYVCSSCNRIVASPSQSPRTTQDDSCDGPPESSVHSEDSNDTDLTSEGKSEDLSSVPKPQSSFCSRGKPLSLAKRGGFLPRLRGGAGEKYGVGKKAVSSSKKRGQTIPVRRGRGNGRGYRGYFNYQNISLQVMESNHSSGKEEGEENKVILVSTDDEFCLEQDVCAMCGAFGQDQEGRLIACAQCGQCYHPFCANVKQHMEGVPLSGRILIEQATYFHQHHKIDTKNDNTHGWLHRLKKRHGILQVKAAGEKASEDKVTKVVLQKGWRCLDCTVCEGCGERNDEARLVLCEDCDISYHIYCMKPPLDHVPSGVWRCKWCAMCLHCGATDPGPNATWQQNYSMCGPCMSMTQCPVCDEPYSDGELIIQCSNCERWLHASDDMIHTEDDAERCAEKGYLCLICRPQDALPPHLLPHTPPARTTRVVQTAIVTTTATPSPVRASSPVDMMTKVTSKAQYWVDGTCLSECGMFQIKTMTLEPQKKPSMAKLSAAAYYLGTRCTGGKEPGLHSRNPKTVRTSRGPSIDSSGSRDIDDDDEDDDDNKLENEEPKHWVYGMKEGTLLQAKDDGTPPDLPEGFYTLPGPEPGTFTLRKRRYRNIKTLGIGGFQVRARGKREEEKAREEATLDPQVLELRRKRSNWRTKKKIKLLEKFPSYIQEAFFGRNLMDTSNLEEEMKQISSLDEEIDEDVLESQKTKSAITLSKDELQLVQAAQNKQHGHDRRLDSCVQQTKLLSPRHIKFEDFADARKRDKKYSDEKKYKDHKDEDMAQEDENNEAIDAIFGQGGDITDILMHDIINGAMKDDDANLTGDDDISQDAIDVPGGSGNGTKLTDILGPGFNLDVADIMKNLPEDSTEDSQDSTLSTSIPPTSTLGGVEGEGSACLDSEASVNSTPTVSPATQPTSSLPSTKEALMTPITPSVTLPAASTLRPNQPPVAPLGSMPTGSSMSCIPQGPTLSSVSICNTIQGLSPIPSISCPTTMQNPVGLASPITHQSPSALPSPLPSPITGGSILSQSHPSPLSRPDSQASSHGYPNTPSSFTTNKPPTPTVPEPQKVWSSNDSQSQSLSLEEDESLGAKATKAAVLYVNVHKPTLKTDYPAVADRERQIRRIWKNLKDTEQKKMLIQRARENKKEYYKNKQEQQRALKSSENMEGNNTPGSAGTPGSINEGVNTDPSPANTPHASPRAPLPSLTPPRPMIVTQRPQMPSGSPMRQGVSHGIIRGPLTHPGLNDPYALPPGTPHPSKSVDSFTHPPSTPTPQTSPLPSPTSDPYSRIPPSPRPHSSDPYSIAPPTPRPVVNDPYTMPPPTPRSVDPYGNQPPGQRPLTSDPFTTCTTPTDSFSQPPASPYAQAPPTPRPHDDVYGPPPPGPPGSIPDPARQQHLRELLQRPWSEGSGVHQTVIPQPLTSPTGLPGEFRPPLPPVVQGQGARMRPSMAPGQPNMMTHPVSPQGGQMDPRVRMILQQRSIQQQQSQRQTVVAGRNPLDPFNPHAQHRPPQQYIGAAGPGVRPGVTNVVRGPTATVMVSQGLGSPHLPTGGTVRVPVVSPTHHPQPPTHPLGPPPHPSTSHPQPPHHSSSLPQPQQSLPQQSHPQQSLPQQSHPQIPHSQPHPQSHPQQPHPPLPHPQQTPPSSQQHQLESELPEAVTRELEQLEEEQQQQQHQDPPPPPPQSTPQPTQSQTAPCQGDDLADLAGEITSMEDDDLLGMGGDFNALLEFADGEDGEEDNEKLPSNLFDDLDGDEDERRKRERGRELMMSRGLQKGKVVISNEIPVGLPSPGMLLHPRPTLSPAHEPENHRISTVTLDSVPQPQEPHQSPTVPHSVQQRPCIEQGVPLQHPEASVASNMAPSGPNPVNVSNTECSNMPSPSTMVPMGHSSGPPTGPPPGPLMSPVRLTMSTSPQQQPVQPQMAPHITRATPRFSGIGVTRMLGHRVGMLRQPAPPPPPYPGHPPPPYPRPQVMVSEGLMVRGPMAGSVGSPMGVGGPPPPPMMRPSPHHPALMGPGPSVVMGGPRLPPHMAHGPPGGHPHLPTGPPSMGPPGPHGPHGPPGPHGPHGPSGPHGPMLPPQPLRRPLLLQEQPLLIEDLLEQEKQEQMKQQKASHHQQQESLGPVDLNLSDMDYEKLKADVLSAGNPSVGLPPIPGGQQVMSGNGGVRQPYQRIVGPPQVSTQTAHQVPGPVQPMTRPVRPQGDPGIHPALLQAVTTRASVSSTPGTVNIKTLPPPPQPPDNPQTDAERQQQHQYEQWLGQQHSLIASQQRFYETEIIKLRKQRKSLNSRQRTLKKNGQELNENDAADLARVQREASAIQRHLEQCRKSARQHAMIVQEYNNKKRNRQSHIISTQGGVMNASPGNMMTGASPMGHAGSSPLHSTPQSPLMSPSPSSQPGMGLSPMVPSPHTPVASPNPTIVPQHSPHAMVVPGPHPSPGESPFSPQTRMPSPGGGYPDQGPRTTYPGAPQGMTHHMMVSPMRVRMPAHSPGTQTVQPGQMSPHMMGVRASYPQAGVMMPQGQGTTMMMRHQYPQGVMPLRRPSGSGPVPSPGSVGPIPSPGGPVPSPLGGGMAMKPSPVHSGLKSPVPLASPSGPVPSPISGNMSMKPSPVHSGLRSPVPLASPQMRSHSAENPGTPLTPRSVGTGEVGGAPHTPHSDMGGASSNSSQVNSPHPSVPTPTSDAVPSPASSSTPTAGVGTVAPRSGGGGGGNANNPNNPAPLPPHIRRFGYFKPGLRGGTLLRSRWGHFKFGLKGGAPLGEIENNTVQTTCSNEMATVASTNTTSNVSTSSSSILRAVSTTALSKNDVETHEGQEGLAHVLSESLKGPVRMIGGSVSRAGQSAYSPAGLTTAAMTPHLSSIVNKVVIPEPSKSEIPPSSRHQAVIGIPGGGAILSQNNMYPSHTVAVAPGIRLPSVNASTNYPSSNIVTGCVATTHSSIMGMAVGTTGAGGISGSLVPPPIMSVTSCATTTASMYNLSMAPTSRPLDEVSTHSTMVSINDQVSGISSGLTNFPNNTGLPSTSVSALTLTTPSLGRPLVSIPVQKIGLQQRPVVHTTGAPSVTTQQLRTLPSIGQLQPGARQFRTQLIRAPVSQQPGSLDLEGHKLVTQQQVMHPSISQPVGVLSSGVPQTLSQQTWIQTSSGTLSQSGVVVQSGLQQTVGVRMVTQPMMVQQTIVRSGNVMVRPATSGQVAVQGGVRMMMIHGGKPVRTPSPPVSRPTMMPPPAAKSPAGHSASPVLRVSPSPSPLSNHPSPHSPQIKGQSPLMGSPAPSPHSSLPTLSSIIKREPDDEHPGPCSTPNMSHSGMAGPSISQPPGTLHVTISGAPSQTTTQLPVMNHPHLTTQNSSLDTGPLKTEGLNEGMSKESSNALLKQLLENTGCASPLQQPPQGQLVLFRSSQGTIPMQSSHLSQVASQVPNPTPIIVPRSIVPVSAPSSHAPALHTTSVASMMSQSADIQQQHHAVIAPGTQPQPLGPSPQLMQRSVVVSGPQQISQNPGTHTVVLGQQQLIAQSGGHVNLSHSVARLGVPFTGQSHPVQHTTGPHPSSQHAGIRQVTTHHIAHPGINPSSGHHVIPGQPTHQTVTVSHPSRPLGHPVTPSGPHMVVHPGLRPAHPGQHPLVNAHPPGTHLVSGSRPTLNSTIMNAAPTPASMADRINSDPALKTEMRVMIPETVMGTGTSTGEHTPEMTTPNDGSDSLDHEELKKAKKRAQQARRKSQSKDTKVQPAKRARQGSRVEEDYDAYIDSVMQQLRSMPPLTIMEPEVPRNFNLCPMFGSGDLTKLGRRDYNHRQGVLEGSEGQATIKNITDFYNTQPFGDKLPIVTPAKTAPTQRGFYIHEFTPPKIGLPLDEYQGEGDSVSGSNRPTPAPTPTRDADSPDTVLSSSSPECILPESPLPFKGLRLVDMDEDPQEDQRDRSLSPSIPLLVPTPIRPGQLPFLPSLDKDSKDIPELDKENIGSLSSITMKSRIGQSPALPLKDMGNVTVTLTLSSQAGEDVSGVLRSLANLLNIPPPSSYQMADRLQAPKLPRVYHHKHPKDGKEQVVDIQSILNGQARFCRHCDIIILKDILCKRVSELPFLNKEEYVTVEEVTFCSQQCYMQFALSHRMVIDERGKHDGSSRFSKLRDTFSDIKDPSSIMPDDDLPDWTKDEDMDEVLRVPKLEDSLLSRPNKHKLEDDEEQFPRQPDGKRFRGHKYKCWTPSALTLPENYEKPTPKEMTDLLFRMGITYRKPRLRDDTRQCILCNLYGDYVADGPSRLLNYDVDKWVHLNCALWAEDVYETMNGALMNVETAMKKVSSFICEHCDQPGASVKCFKVRCNKVYHLNCAVKEGCTFYKNKTVYCQEHINKGEKDNELSTLAVFRRVFIDRDENRQVASVMHHADMSYILRIGSLILLSIGQLFPHQLQAFHTPYCIYPVGYQVIRFYWSMRRLHKRCAYECSIHENDAQPEFRITVKEDGYEDHTFVSCSPKGVWNKVLEPLTEMRHKADVVRLFPQYISGEDLFGLTEPAIVRILESLPGIDTLGDYNFKYGRNPLFELPLAVNPSGCARAEPFNKLHLKRYHGMRTSAGSVRTSSNCRTAASVATLTMAYDPFVPYSKLHVHSRSSQYKKMKNEWRSVVYLARSKIQGLGLYAARDIEKNTMIIEYIGEIIRSELAEVREKRYEAQNRGIYMFRLDDQRVVDATVTGGLARYVNHSCGPNCYTETIEVERDLKILIISNRKILRGEELAYDYKFDEEEDHKIPCLCGAENCRKWMN